MRKLQTHRGPHHDRDLNPGSYDCLIARLPSWTSNSPSLEVDDAMLSCTKGIQEADRLGLR